MKKNLLLIIAMLAIIFSATFTINGQSQVKPLTREGGDKSRTTEFKNVRPTQANLVMVAGDNADVRLRATIFPWTQNFDGLSASGAGVIPTGWAQYNAVTTPTSVPKWARGTANFRRGTSGYGQYHNYTSAGISQESWLVTSVISIPNDGKIYTLAFWDRVQYPTYYAYNGVWISDGTGNPSSDTNFVEVWHPASYTQGTTTNYSDWTQYTIDLSNYAGKDIYIAFVYAGDDSHAYAIDDVVVDGITPPTTDLSITSVSAGGYTQLPLKHVAGYNFTAAVKNSGAPLSAPVTLNVTANNSENYAGSATISSLGYLATTSVNATPAFSTSSTGNYTATFTLDYTDATPGDNTASIPFVVTEHTFASDKGTLASAGGVGMTSSGYSFGNQFELTASDIIKSISVGWANAAATQQFNFKIYSFIGGVATPVWTSEEFTRPITSGITAGGAAQFQEYVFSSPQSLPAGKYIFTVNQTSATNIGIGYDGVAGGTFYLISPGNVVSPQTSFGYAALRVNTLEEVAYDASITAITAPVSGDALTATESVTVTISNNGTNAISNFDLGLFLNNTPIATEAYTGAAIPAYGTGSYTFDQKVDLSAAGSYTIKAVVVLANDEIPTNDEFIKVVKHLPPSVTLYGYRIYEDGATAAQAYNVVTFNSNTPQTVTIANNYKDGSNSVAAGEYYDGKYYLFTRTSSAAANFVILSTNDWTEVSKVAITTAPNDLAYDYSTHQLYAISGSPSALSTVNLTTGALNAVVTLDRYLFTLSANIDGTLYGVDATGNWVEINKTSGAITVVGTTGITPSYIQSAAFDHNTGRLFWAMSNSSDEGKLIELNPATGAVENDFGLLGANIELVGLYTPYTQLDLTFVVDSVSPVAGTLAATTQEIKVYFDDPIVDALPETPVSFSKPTIFNDGTNVLTAGDWSISDKVLTISLASVTLTEGNWKLKIPCAKYTNADGTAIQNGDGYPLVYAVQWTVPTPPAAPTFVSASTAYYGEGALPLENEAVIDKPYFTEGPIQLNFSEVVSQVDGMDVTLTHGADVTPLTVTPHGFNAAWQLLATTTYNWQYGESYTLTIPAGAFIDANDGLTNADSTTITFIVNGPTSAVNSISNSISVYPNPVRDELRILNYELKDVRMLEIFDIAGKLVRSYTLLSNTINVSTLQSGVYFLKFDNNILKFVKE